MSNEQKKVRIELTTEQQALVKERTGKDVQVIELSTGEELEKRIAPASLTFGSGPHITYNP